MKTMTWNEAVQYAQSLGEGWRLPSVKELLTLWDYDKGVAVIPMISSSYWSSTANADFPYYAWYVSFNYGYVYFSVKHNSSYVRCVRGGQFDSLGNLIIAGVPEGLERTTTNEDGTITDNLTGLVWERV